MGKTKRKLRSAKYAKKYASVRATVAKLRAVKEQAMADGVVTLDEVKQIEAVKEEVVQAQKAASVPEPVTPVVEAPPVEKPVAPKPVAKKPAAAKKAVPKKAAAKKTTARKSTAKKTTTKSSLFRTKSKKSISEG